MGLDKEEVVEGDESTHTVKDGTHSMDRNMIKAETINREIGRVVRTLTGTIQIGNITWMISLGVAIGKTISLR